jgi:hypothetical protein
MINRKIFLVALVFVSIMGLSTFYVMASYTVEVYPRTIVHDSNEWYFLSIGLYQNTTHPCEIHSITCLAEYQTTELNYTIVSDDGTYFASGVKTTNSNGFLDLYLPANQNYSVEFSIGELTGTGSISTIQGSPTCITDIQMS